MKILLKLKNGVTRILDNEWDQSKTKKEFEEKFEKSFDEEILNIIFSNIKEFILFDGYSLKDIKSIEFEK